MRGETFARHLLLPATAAMLLSGLAGSTPAIHATTGAPLETRMTAPVAQMPRGLFISGHSLTDRPFPDYLAASVAARGLPFAWDMQHLFGSSLSDRTRGVNGDGSGYRSGIDRQGEPADALRSLSGEDIPYDALLLAEQHSLLESLLWKDMVPSAADYVARFRAGNPAGRTYLFAAWLNVDDLHDPRRWIAYERSAEFAWACAAARIAKVANAPVSVVPAAAALALLVEKASSGQLPGAVAADARSATAMIFTDDVHLTQAGSYYVALITHGVLFGGLPAEPWVPEGLSRETAAALNAVARTWFDDHARSWDVADAGTCHAYFGDSFAVEYLAYVRDARWRREQGIAAYLKWARFRLAWPRLLRGTSPNNPLPPVDGA